MLRCLAISRKPMHQKFQKFLEISRQLRAEGGCPWYKAQTLASNRQYLQEEMEELIEAIDKEDWENMEEEMGDLLFCLITVGLIAEEKGHFDLGGVFEKVSDKLVRRTTWVFGDDIAETPEEAMEIWEKNKQKEK